jgi:hypothetical protein
LTVLGGRVSVVSVPLVTMPYGELVAMIYTPLIVALTGVLIAAVRYRRSGRTAPKR